MATIDGETMNIAWVIASGYAFDPKVNIGDVKAVGPVWGSWKVWRNCSVDNVICDDLPKAKELLSRAFQAVCNFYLPRRHYQDLNRPQGAHWYDGEFKQDTHEIDDIIAMHLSSTVNDIILLLGFDLSITTDITDPMEKHRIRNRLGLIRQVIVDRSDVQWVFLDHPKNLDPAFSDVANITRDNFSNALKLSY
jgi:hypothetical protein